MARTRMARVKSALQAYRSRPGAARKKIGKGMRQVPAEGGGARSGGAAV